MLRDDSTAAGEVDSSWLDALADELGDPALRVLVDAALTRQHEIARLWPDDETAATADLRRERVDALKRELRHDFAAALVPLGRDEPVTWRAVPPFLTAPGPAPKIERLLDTASHPAPG